MKKVCKFIFIISVFVFAQHIFAEEIQNYQVDMHLHKDASVTITETIDYDFGNIQKHGIFRFIPFTFHVEGQKKLYGLKQRVLTFKNLSVQRDGVPESYTKKDKDSNGNYFIKIGKPNKVINGLHHYVIQYDVLGSLRYFDDYDEVYWNAIGLDWKVPIRKASVHLHSDGIPFKNTSCYAGKLHDTKECIIERNNNEIIFSQSNLGDHEGMTVAASFDKGLVPRTEFYVFTQKALVSGILFSIVFLLGVAWFWIRKYRRKYFSYDPIHPRYTPPEDFNSIFTGYLIDRKLDPQDISAGIIELARDGYISIERIEANNFFNIGIDYLFTLKRDIDNEPLSEDKKSILFLLFDDEQNIADLLQTTPSFVSNENKEGTKIGKQVYLHDIAKRNNRTQFSFIENFLRQQAVNKEFIEVSSQKNGWFLLVPFIATLISFFIGKIVVGFILFIITFVSFFIAGMMNTRYTKKGWEIKHAIEGFKLFLSMTEKERYEFFNRPADNPQEFMEYLPYAIALGVEKKWAKQFASITIPQPTWYRGNGGPFVATAFADEMSIFSQSVGSSVATKASSGSGSGGGGFSGGGAGGGGGGSW